MQTVTFLHHNRHHVQIPIIPTSKLASLSKPTNHFYSFNLHSPNSSPPLTTNNNRQQHLSCLLLLSRTNYGYNKRQRFRRFLRHGDDPNEDDVVKKVFDNKDGGFNVGTVLGLVLAICVFGGFGYVGIVFKDRINQFLIRLSKTVEGYGPAGYVLFVAIYAGLEILVVPSTPLTMSAGLLFGTSIGTVVASISGAVAATVAFLIARYFIRERMLKLVEGNKKFHAIDKAIEKNSFGVVTLLRMSPLLPFSIGNYLYGLTSVKFVPYILGSWLGMLPGTWAYVSAGAFGRALITEKSGTALHGKASQLLTVGIGLLTTALAAAYVTHLTKDAVKDEM
ncbi:hypothetical protein ACFE04_000332 [Oxalis oulophora]